jgi:hypothetical protein
LGHLIEWLPALQHMPLVESPTDVAIALDVLPRIREALAGVVIRTVQRSCSRPGHSFMAGLNHYQINSVRHARITGKPVAVAKPELTTGVVMSKKLPLL